MYEYEAALADNNLTFGQLPQGLRARINSLKILAKRTDQDPDREAKIMKADLVISEEIQNFAEANLPDNEEEHEEIGSKTTKTNNMPTEAQKALMLRAKAVGLPETSSEAQVAAAEKKIQDDDQAAAQAKADGESAQAKADADAKAAADKAAADAKVAAEADMFDDLGL